MCHHFVLSIKSLLKLFPQHACLHYGPRPHVTSALIPTSLQLAASKFCFQGSTLTMTWLTSQGSCMQVLHLNSRRLHPDYTQAAREAWGTGSSTVDVSFLMPAAPLTVDQICQLQARCAHPSCGMPAHLQCSRCQVCVPLHVCF